MKRRIIKKVIISLILMFGSISIGTMYAFFFHKELNIKPFDKEVEVLVNTEYNDQKIDMCYGSVIKCQELKYETDGEVDTNTLGDYILTYTYKVGSDIKHLNRTIHVYDDIKPEITNNSDIVVCKDDKVVSSDYKATDNYDGDITDKVELIKEDEEYYLTVADSSSNTEKVLVNTKDYDGEPELSLVGDSTIYLTKGSKYSEKGYKASDKCDGDLNDKVNVSGSVDTNTVGTYTLTYKVTNSIGKSVSKTRTIKVINKSSVSSSSNIAASGKKIIYLTFDDGPGAHTNRLLNILDKYNVKATFFVTNQFGSKTYQNIISREARSGHTVCVHSYTHNYNIYKSVDAYFNDFNKMNNLIEKQTGKKSNCVRFPGGSSNTVSRRYKYGIMTTLANELNSRGYRYYDWNLSSGDAGGTTSSRGVYNNVVRNLRGGVYNILMHDIKKYTVDAIEDIIKYGLANGYTFLPITSTSPTFHQRINN